MNDIDPDQVSLRKKIHALLDVARYKPKFAALLVLLGLAVAALEAVGLSFIVPIVEIVQADNPSAEAEGLSAAFLRFYQVLGVPFTLEFVIVGVAVVMTARYTGSFLYSWFRRLLRYSYLRHLQKQAFNGVLNARMNHFDTEGSDKNLNIIVTETKMASEVINKSIKAVNSTLFTIVYLFVALWISPLLTLFAIVILGVLTFALQSIVNPGYELGERVADGNERRQETAQAGVMGIRDIRIFHMENELYNKFVDAVDTFTRNKVKLKRNESALRNFYNLAVAVSVFVLIYLGLQVANLPFGELALFLFVMFMLGPKISTLNEQVYSISNELPHLIRSQQFIRDLDSITEPSGGTRDVPEEIATTEFDDVSFSYNGEEPVLRGVSFTVRKGEFVGFVGQSGAGKSTIVSLLARYYEPDGGRIYANRTPIDEMDPREWRDRLAIVRQNPYIFNDTLRYNLTIGNREATQREIERACEIARVDEFLNQLPDGYDSYLGDDGVQLSGGQKQRVALARALLKDAEILILDEATSDLDSNLERQVQQEIEQMDRDYAIITIAHRLSTVENADRIYTMEDGRISERGPHGELVNEGGKYAELYGIQS